MRTIALTALLLTAPSAAQGHVPATVPVSTAPAAVPASTPATMGTPLRITAPVGTTVELQITTQSRMSMGKVEVTAAPGRQVSAARLQAMQQEMSRGMAGGTVPAVSGKLFVRVAARAADGSVTLLTSMTQSIPGEKAPLTLRVTQQVAPNGSITGLSMDSDHPMMKTMLAGFTSERIRQFASQSGADYTGIYGQPLVRGAAHTQTAAVDVQGILSAVLQAVAGPDAEVPASLGRREANALKTTTTTTYVGINAQGLHTFTHSGRSDAYTLDLGALGLGGVQAGQRPSRTLKVEMLNAQAAGTSTYRADGLPGPFTQQSSMQMVMTTQRDNMIVKMPMTMTQTLTARPR